MIHEETIDYRCNGTTFLGYLANDPTITGKKPAILVAHAWKGQDDFAREKARDLAKLGYIGFAADLYGSGKIVETDEEAAAMMTPLFINRKKLRERIVAAYNTVIQQNAVNKDQVGAIGFCFGGLTVIELLRSGVKLKGVVSFHGLFGDSLGDIKAELAPSTPDTDCSILLLHGYHDPLVSQHDVVHIQKELSNAKIDWQMHIFGNASHAFTNPKANEPEKGLIYDLSSDVRSWKSMISFFQEIIL